MSFNKHDLTINLALQQDGPWTYCTTCGMHNS